MIRFWSKEMVEHTHKHTQKGKRRREQRHTRNVVFLRSLDFDASLLDFLKRGNNVSCLIRV